MLIILRCESISSLHSCRFQQCSLLIWTTASISPSIYVAFESLYATDLCGDVGKAIPRTTIAFDETAVSTSLDFQWNTEAYYPFTVRTPDAFTQAHFGDQ
jgi:hypothetical protein